MKIEIAIESDFDFAPMYLVHHLVGAWRDTGHEVRVRSLSEPPQNPDAALLHVNRSLIPEAVVERLSYECPLVNGEVLDITKRRVSRQLVTRHDGYAGQVIVKTNENYFGIPERERAPRLGRISRLFRRGYRRSCRFVGRSLPDREYPTYPDSRAVPKWLWRSHRHVVERFTPERDGEFFVLRNWLFLGDREVGITCWSLDPIVKAQNIERHAIDTSIPDELRERRRELGFDYGKFDWVLVDGRAILLDANRTPTIRPRSERAKEIVANLARGIDSFLSEG